MRLFPLRHPVFWLALPLLLVACRAAPPPPPVETPTALPPPPAIAPTNLLSILILRQNSATQEVSAELYPIAFLANEKFVDVSTDVTRDRGDGTEDERTIELTRDRSFLEALPRATVLDREGRGMGEFGVDRLAIGQFACSSLIIGQGTSVSGKSLREMFEAIPAEEGERRTGGTEAEPTEEIQKFAIAVSQPPPAISPPPTPSDADRERYRRDALEAAAAAIANSDSPLRDAEGNLTVETLRTFDLNRDGSPELFALATKEVDPALLTEESRDNKLAVSLWLGYANGAPQTLLAEVSHRAFQPHRRCGCQWRWRRRGARSTAGLRVETLSAIALRQRAAAIGLHRHGLRLLAIATLHWGISIAP